MKERAFVGLGGNVGDRLGRLGRAVRWMSTFPETRVVRVSPVYETSPVGPRQKDFLNAVAEIETSLSPSVLLHAFKKTERALGRRRRGKWGPREIDLDLILYGSRAGRASGVVWPHPRFRERKFVLKPLSDLAPEWRDPVTGLTVGRLLRRLTAADQRVTLFKRRLSWKK